MANYKERYSPKLLGVNEVAKIEGNSVGGFLCKTAGTITIVNASGATVVSAHPVTAGLYYPMPFLLSNTSGADGATVTLAGGASGTLGV